jgi:hypothetical protein
MEAPCEEQGTCARPRAAAPALASGRPGAPAGPGLAAAGAAVPACLAVAARALGERRSAGVTVGGSQDARLFVPRCSGGPALGAVRP